MSMLSLPLRIFAYNMTHEYEPMTDIVFALFKQPHSLSITKWPHKQLAIGIAYIIKLSWKLMHTSSANLSTMFPWTDVQSNTSVYANSLFSFLLTFTCVRWLLFIRQVICRRILMIMKLFNLPLYLFLILFAFLWSSIYLLCLDASPYGKPSGIQA